MITDIEQACDRLIVLGKGHTLLDLSIAEALAHHRVIEGGPAALVGTHRIVGSFPSAGGDALTLVRVPTAGAFPPDPAVVGRPATLEEVVIGHMAAGRVRRLSALDEAAA